MADVKIYCDGSCLGNPGPGGYAALLMFKGKADHEKVVAGFELSTTNNRMELRAAIEGLRSLTKKCRVTLWCDSLYVVKGMTEWMQGWQKSGFKRGKVANIDLWQELLQVADEHAITWQWVRGHAGHQYNERVDEIAREQAGLALHQLKTRHK